MGSGFAIKNRVLVVSCLILTACCSAFSNASGRDLRHSAPYFKPVFNCKDVAPNDDFVNFESGQVRPLALSDNKKLLFVANTPANCLEIYSVKRKKIRRVGAVQVGIEPVAIAVNGDEVWVVNHLSDSVSIVDVSRSPYVKRTLQVGDEPRDIVFAGVSKKRAFITTAHRGQNHRDFKFENLRTPGIGRADVWVYDADNPGTGLSGSPVAILSLFTDTPRALAVSADGKTVYAAGFLTGNQTTVVGEKVVLGQQPLPNTDADGVLAPQTGLVLKFNGEAWLDEAGTDWSDEVMLSLPDKDVFAIDAEAEVPTVVAEYAHVGTTLFNMTVNPATNSIYVSNTEARNHVRFEGPGTNSTTVRGHTAENRITLIKGNTVTPIHLNPHVDFSLPVGEAIPESEKVKSIAQPLEMALSKDGAKLYVSAFGSGKIAVIPTEQLEGNGYVPDASQHIAVPGGPTGLVLSADDSRLYVYSRFENVLSVINTRTNKVVDSVSLYNPEPEYIVQGRPFLYDADFTSGNGTGSCASCHIFGDLDSLAWDLGNPDDVVVENPLPPSPGNLLPLRGTFHPLKGPMTTQTLRGIVDSGPMHWRGDRTGTNPDIVDGVEESQEAAAFKEFNGAFVNLVGRETVLSTEEMQKFTDFALSLRLPPNPIRNLDNSLTADQANGRDVYFNDLTDSGLATCNSCHALNPAEGQFGSDGLMINDGPLFSQDFKVPHFRNLYQKVGMFGSAGINNSTYMGDQIRGFGYRHDGGIATVDDFLFGADVFFFDSVEDGLNVSDFLMVYDSNYLPVVGQQVTLSRYSSYEEIQRLELLIQQALDGACALDASGLFFGFDYSADFSGGKFQSEGLPPLSQQALLSAAKYNSSAITFTCKPLAL